jgi:hypothetical protein
MFNVGPVGPLAVGLPASVSASTTNLSCQLDCGGKERAYSLAAPTPNTAPQVSGDPPPLKKTLHRSASSGFSFSFNLSARSRPVDGERTSNSVRSIRSLLPWILGSAPSSLVERSIPGTPTGRPADRFKLGSTIAPGLLKRTLRSAAEASNAPSQLKSAWISAATPVITNLFSLPVLALLLTGGGIFLPD